MPEFTYRGYTMPDRLIEGIRNYAENHILPGGFLQAVLCNNLSLSVLRADDESLAALPAVLIYVYNEVPSDCWGSPFIVGEWVSQSRNPVLQ